MNCRINHWQRKTAILWICTTLLFQNHLCLEKFEHITIYFVHHHLYWCTLSAGAWRWIVEIMCSGLVKAVRGRLTASHHRTAEQAKCSADQPTPWWAYIQLLESNLPVHRRTSHFYQLATPSICSFNSNWIRFIVNTSTNNNSSIINSDAVYLYIYRCIYVWSAFPMVAWPFWVLDH